MSDYISEEKVKSLELKANDIRQDIITMLTKAGSGHTAGALGMADIFSALYFHTLNHRPQEPEWEKRDRLILSNGHICPVRYAAMAHAGYFPVEELKTLRTLGSRLQGHPERERLPGMETTSGPLGSGLGQAIGLAMAARLNGAVWRTYCIMSDGEQDEGITWESAMLAGKYHLRNLTGIIDRNNIQIDGMTEDVMPLESLRAKWEAFNWHVLEIDGHNIEQFVDAVEQAKAIYEKPTVIIAHTIPGKGIKTMGYDAGWHGKVPKPEEAEQFLVELRAVRATIDSSHH
jgi:transketolase